MSLPISILDLVPIASATGGSRISVSGQAIRNSLELAELADTLGYARYWFAEHHNMSTIASTTPEIMIALAGARTSRIHIGSGGVMLPNHAPLKVAETFKMLEALYPGRIDLGIGRAPGTDHATAHALRGTRQALGADQFPQQLAELLYYGGKADAHGLSLQDGPRPGVAAIPVDVLLPPVWLLGSSDYSAQLAAMLGMGFGFAAHFSDYPPEEPMRAYRDQFSPSAELARPHAILTLSVLCADTDQEAERQLSSLLVAFARLRTGQTAVLLPPEEAVTYRFSHSEQAVVDSIRGRHIAGTPASVKQRIESLVERTMADEVMISTFIHGHTARMHSCRLLAAEFGLADSAQLAGRRDMTNRVLEPSR